MAPNRRLTLIALAASALLTACGGGSSSSVPEETRPQDGRTFSTASTSTTLASRSPISRDCALSL